MFSYSLYFGVINGTVILHFFITNGNFQAIFRNPADFGAACHEIAKHTLGSTNRVRFMVGILSVFEPDALKRKNQSIIFSSTIPKYFYNKVRYVMYKDHD